jgi:hypothetical protein
METSDTSIRRTIPFLAPVYRLRVGLLLMPELRFSVRHSYAKLLTILAAVAFLVLSFSGSRAMMNRGSQ